VPWCAVVMKAGGTERPGPRRAQRRCSAGIRTQTNAAADSGRAASGTRAPSRSGPVLHVCRYFANPSCPPSAPCFDDKSTKSAVRTCDAGRYRAWPTQRPIEGKAPPCVASGLGERRRETVQPDSSERVNDHRDFFLALGPEGGHTNPVASSGLPPEKCSDPRVVGRSNCCHVPRC
jgi:hypothetical protein